MSQRRQLSAILFTDIEGYTAIMQKDEGRAITLKDRHREVLLAKHKEFNGKVIQFYGDGTLSIFQSVVDAIYCALSMQLLFREQSFVPVRMGLHVGDVILDNEHVVGDSVNLASRIESLGVAGCVLLSDKVNDEIQNHPEIKTISLGSYQLKNINRVVEVFALDHAGLIVPARDSLVGKAELAKKRVIKRRDNLQVQFSKPIKSASEKSIAVLPFVNMSNDPEQEYFGDGVAEEILNSLSHLKDLKVVGRSSSFQFNKRIVNLTEVKEKLGVSTVLEGSVRKQGNRLRITVQLVNVEDGFHLWSEKYDRNLDDIFAIQDEIATAISEKLKVTLLDKVEEKPLKLYRHNPQAYDLYLKGRFYINRRGASIFTGIKLFEQAIELDPDFALAHAGFADANLLAAFYGLIPPLQVLSKAKESAEKAIALNPTISEPYCSLGSYYTFERKWDEAENYFQKAIALSPNYPQAYYWYGLNLLAWVIGDFDEAEQYGQMAQRLDPYSAITNAAYGAILFTVGKFKEALIACKAGLELDAYSFLCRLYEANAYMCLGQYEDAINSYEKAMKISNRHHFAQNGLIVTYCRMGNYVKARALMADLKERQTKTYIAYGFTGISAAYLGNLDEAFEYFEKAFQNKEPILLTLKHEPYIPANLKEDDRYLKLLSRIGFPEHN
jgi:TolB-like protein/class 3 adenylate cyclase/Flp pilus assembly protein TadD